MTKDGKYGRAGCRALYTVHRYSLVSSIHVSLYYSIDIHIFISLFAGFCCFPSFPEVDLPSESHSFKGSFSDVVDIEKLFVAGILDELKICFSCGYEVHIYYSIFFVTLNL